MGRTGAGPRRGGTSPSPLSFGPTGVTGFAGVVVGGVVDAGGVVVVGGRFGGVAGPTLGGAVVVGGRFGGVAGPTLGGAVVVGGLN